MRSTVLRTEEDRDRFYESFEDTFVFAVSGEGETPYIVTSDEYGEMWGVSVGESGSYWDKLDDIKLPITILPAKHRQDYRVQTRI